MRPSLKKHSLWIADWPLGSGNRLWTTAETLGHLFPGEPRSLPCLPEEIAWEEPLPVRELAPAAKRLPLKIGAGPPPLHVRRQARKVPPPRRGLYDQDVVFAHDTTPLIRVRLLGS